jgi:hypothetical protein
MAVETETATVRKIGIVTGIRNVIVGTEIGTGIRIRTRIGTAGIATTRKRMTNVAAGVPTASVAHLRHLARRKTILGPHFHARAKTLACRPTRIKKNFHFFPVSIFFSSQFWFCFVAEKKCSTLYDSYLNVVAK